VQDSVLPDVFVLQKVDLILSGTICKIKFLGHLQRVNVVGVVFDHNSRVQQQSSVVSKAKVFGDLVLRIRRLHIKMFTIQTIDPDAREVLVVRTKLPDRSIVREVEE